MIYNLDLWTKIKGHNSYLVSTSGKIYSNKTNKELKPSVSRDGYKYVSLDRKKEKIHRLVAIAFLKEKNGNIVCHKNGNSLDNRVENLYWGTIKENVRDSQIHGTWVYGSKNGNSKLQEKDVLEIRRLLRSNKYYQREIAEMFNIATITVRKIANRKLWNFLT